MEIETREEYYETENGWSYSIFNAETGEELTNSLNVPSFSNRDSAEESATGWLIQNGLI